MARYLFSLCLFWGYLQYNADPLSCFYEMHIFRSMSSRSPRGITFRVQTPSPWSHPYKASIQTL